MYGLGKHRTSLFVAMPGCLGCILALQALVCFTGSHGGSWGLPGSGWVPTGGMSFQLNLLSCVLSVASTWVCVGVAAAAQKLHVYCVFLGPQRALMWWLF
jgi:hypothetical protein